MKRQLLPEPCPSCGGPVYYAGTGRHPVFCSDTCRRPTRNRHPPGWTPPPPARPYGLAAFLIREAPTTNPTLARALQRAEQLQEIHGWSDFSLKALREGLAIVLADKDPAERVRASEVRGHSSTRFSAKLVSFALADLGLLEDDTVPAIRRWIDRRTTEVPTAFRSDVYDWLTWLHTGDQRNFGYPDATLYCYFGKALPILKSLARKRSHLREITEMDLITATNKLNGRPRTNTIVALRSLFRWATKHRRVFANPTKNLHCGRAPLKPALPLHDTDVTAVTRAAANPNTTAWRLVIALSCIHAARQIDIRNLLLDDVDIPNRRLTIGGVEHPLDDLTLGALSDYLTERRTRWPNTINPHLLVSRTTALRYEPVSTFYLKQQLNVRDRIRIEDIRVDRIMEEARVTGPDALHLTVVFGFSPFTGMRYAEAARMLLDPPPPGPKTPPN